MSKEKVYIVISHKYSLKKDPRTGKFIKDQWEVNETVEFVNQLRNRHTTTSSAIGDYLNRKLITGTKLGMTDYDQFEQYVRKKYTKQMEELDAAYRPKAEEKINKSEIFVDSFGNVRAKTVFDL